MEQARDEVMTLRNESVSSIHRITHKTYSNTNIGGNAAVVLGDNHGIINNQYGDHHYYLTAREGDGPNGGSFNSGDFDRDKFKALLVSLTFDGMGVRLRNVSPALLTTCQWLRNHETLVSWLGDDNSPKPPGSLWIKGKPGSGKSTMMRETLLWVTRKFPQQIFVSYFFDARSPHRLAKSTLGMYQSILHQLLSAQAKTSETRDRICEIQEFFLKEFSSKIHSSQIEHWSETEIQNFMIVLADTQNLPAFTIFVDALDEDDGDDVQQMIAFFEDLQQRVLASNGALRICLSSRHYPHVTIGGESIVLEEQLGHSEDISKYVRTRLLGKEGRGKSKLREKIVEKAAGVFLWVVLVIQILNQGFNCGKELASMERTLDSAPEKVQDLFNDILAGEEGNREECATLLGWILFAERSLNPIEVCSALRHTFLRDTEPRFSLEDEDEDVSRYILYCSRGLVELCKGTPPTVQFIHETVRELLLTTTFLTGYVSNPSATTLAVLVEQTGMCHGKIAESCLTYLCANPQWYLGNPLASYAANYWWRHLEKTPGPYRLRSLELASEFLTDSANEFNWVELLWESPNDNVLIAFGRNLTKNFHTDPDRPLCRAVLANIPELVREYVGAGLHLNHGGESVAALCCAVVSRKANIVKTLLELGADPNAAQDHSALRLAVTYGDATLVRMLLEAGAVVDVIEDGRTPLMSAAELGSVGMVNALLDWGADIDLEGLDGSALVCATRLSGGMMMKTLIGRGADVGLGNVRGSPLGTAAALGSRGKVELLLDYGAPVDYGGENCESPLETAKRRGHREIVELLLSYGAGAETSLFKRHSQRS